MRQKLGEKQVTLKINPGCQIPFYQEIKWEVAEKWKRWMGEEKRGEGKGAGLL